MTQQYEEVSGTVDHLIFQSEDTGFAVFILTVNAATKVTVRGHIPNLHDGQQVTLKGSWTSHPKFGRQFQANECVTALPTSVTGIQKYLASGLIKGIGPVYAEKLVKRFGEKTLEVIDKQPERLAVVDGIGPKRLATIMEAWKDQRDISAIMVFLQEKGASATYATKIYKRYGQEAITIVTENPYRLAEDIWGIGFKIADQIAQNLGFEKNSLKRIRAGILFVLTTTVGQGSLYGELEKVRTQTLELLELNPETDSQKVKNALHDLYNTKKIALVSHQDSHYVALQQHYATERACATHLKKLLAYPPLSSFNLDAVYQSLRATREDAPVNGHEIELSDDQQRGIMASLQHKVTVITGGPGTGKTTLIKKLLGVLEANSVRYALAAPTGRAAKRITESTGKHAMTIHRLLGFDFSTHTFVHNETNALSVDFLILDEASMIDIFLVHGIIKALPLSAHLLFIGDSDQLPSVGAGNVLKDLISSSTATNNPVASIRLNHIFRQALDSMIIVNAHRVHKGEFPTTSLPDAKKDFLFIKEEKPEQVTAHLTKIFGEVLARHHIHKDDAMVLVPMNRGSVGTQSINHALQGLLNPSTQGQGPTATHLGTTFKLNDRVMQIRNNYDKHIFNGDIGTITAIDTEERTLTVNFGELVVPYEMGDLDELVLAYAITIHKSQGSEYGAVIIPLFTQHFTLLQRNLIYTAITRAKKLCILIGQTKAIAIAVRNNTSLERITFLHHFLTSDLACR
jgi:exodeoxyribonuclease V alpha subunit